MMFDNFSLLDNLISVCYDSYTDEELFALLGIERKKFIYQNGQTKLKDAYFYHPIKNLDDSSLRLIK